MTMGESLGQVGDRVKLLYTDEPYSVLKRGDEGVVKIVDSLGTRHVQWDNGRTLGLLPHQDKWRVLGR